MMAFATRAVAAGQKPVRALTLGALVAALVQCGGTQQEETMTPASYYDPNAETRVILSDTSEEVPSVAAEPADTTTAAAPPRTLANAQALSESQIAGVLDVANESQIELARGAQARSDNPKVKSFAASLIANYNQARQRREALPLQPAESQLSADIGVDAGRTRGLLQDDDEKNFDQAFIASQIDIHRKFLKALDEKLLPSARTSELRSLLQEQRAKAEKQLKQAEEIQAALEK